MAENPVDHRQKFLGRINDHIGAGKYLNGSNGYEGPLGNITAKALSVLLLLLHDLYSANFEDRVRGAGGKFPYRC